MLGVVCSSLPFLKIYCTGRSGLSVFDLSVAIAPVITIFSFRSCKQICILIKEDLSCIMYSPSQTSNSWSLLMNLSSWFPRVCIGSAVVILSQTSISPSAQADEPSCRCDSEWCYVRQGFGWQPVSPGAMSNGFRQVCNDAWNQHNGAPGRPGPIAFLL